MMNATAPITGGMSCPPVEATASIAAAECGLYPALRMSGMVITPVDRTFDTALPEIVPKRLDAMIDIFAEPPRERPMAAEDSSVKNVDPPERNSSAPNKRKAMTIVVTTFSGAPIRELVSKVRYVTS
jgi:hypothetical protein